MTPDPGGTAPERTSGGDVAEPASAAPATGRTPGSRRLLGVDATRGLALLGMMAVHVLPSTAADGSLTTSHLVAGGRSAATFAVLAGVGLALLTGGPDPPAGRRHAGAAAGLVVRALAIGVIGLLLGEVESGVAVILAYYAVLFLIAAPLLGLRAGPLAALSVAIAVIVPVLSFAARDDDGLPFGGRNPTFETLAESPGAFPEALLVTGYYPALAWTAYLCAGMAAGRLALRRRRTAGRLLALGLAVAVAASVASELLLGPAGGRDAIEATVADPNAPAPLDHQLYGNVPTTTWWWLTVDLPHSSTPFDLVHTTGAAIALLGLLLLLARAGRLARALMAPVAAAGSMTLTLYSAHVLLLSSKALPADAETSYAVQVAAALVVALVWRRFVGRGPVEAAVAAAAGAVRRAVVGGNRLDHDDRTEINRR